MGENGQGLSSVSFHQQNDGAAFLQLAAREGTADFPFAFGRMQPCSSCC